MQEYPQETVFLALTVAGVILPWVVQVVKRTLGWEGRAALWVTFAVSVLAALVAGAAAGEVFAPISATEPTEVVGVFLARVLWVFGLATLVYKNLQGRAGL